MRSLINPYFLLSLLSYAVVKGSILLGLEVPELIRNYAADLLAMPVVLSIILVLTRKIKKAEQLTLPITAAVFVFAYWSIYFEWYLPGRNPNQTGDIWDVVMYAIGTTSFLIWQKMSGAKQFQEA